MSVRGWETRSAASTVSIDERRARQVAAFQQQQQSPPPSYGREPRSATRGRDHSVPVPPPHAPQNDYYVHRPHDGPQRHQHQMPYPPQQKYDQQYDPRDPRDLRQPPTDRNPLQQSGYREQVPPYYDQRHAPSPSPSPQQLQRKHYTPTTERTNGSGPYHAPPQYDQRQPLMEPPPQQVQRHNGYSSPLPPPPRQQNYEDYRRQQSQPPLLEEDEDYDTLPPPLPMRRGPAPAPIPIEIPNLPVRQTALPSATSSADEEPVNMDDVLLGKRWSVHVISHLYQFQRQELGDYAHELVKYLRGHAVMTYEQEFGYSVMIRFTSECVVFQVIEARDLHAEFLIEKREMEQPPRSNQTPELEKQESSELDDIRQRAGSFVVYFPKSAEDASVSGGPGSRRNRHAVGYETGSDGSGSATRADPRYVFLLRGNEELMAWVSSWVQRRFQCIVGIHVVRVTEENLRRVTRNWVIEALEREEKQEKARLRKAERLRKISAASDEDMAKNGHKAHDARSIKWPTRAPLLLKYRAIAESDVVKAFTMTMPWASVRRVHALMDGGVGSALGTVPEVIERLEHLYFGNLKKDVAAMTLVGVQMEEVEVDTMGKVKFFKSTMVHSILQSFLDIFVVQQVSGPTEPETNF